jgi:alpha-1,2-mannosyltransferase
VTALVVLGWSLLKRGHVAWAGVPIGIATCLKLYPGLLLIYLLVRYPRALLSAIATIFAATVIPVIWTGWQIYFDYYHMAGRVAAMYGDHPANLSLPAALRKNGFSFSGALFSAISAAIVAASVWVIRRRRRPSAGELLDLQYSLFLVLIPLISPIAWEHYLVILILPLAVAGDWILNREPDWTGIIGFSFLLLVLSLPTNTLVFGLVDKSTAEYVGVKAILALTAAMGALAVVIVRMHMRTSNLLAQAVTD